MSINQQHDSVGKFFFLQSFSSFDICKCFNNFGCFFPEFWFTAIKGCIYIFSQLNIESYSRWKTLTETIKSTYQIFLLNCWYQVWPSFVIFLMSFLAPLAQPFLDYYKLILMPLGHPIIVSQFWSDQTNRAVRPA